MVRKILNAGDPGTSTVIGSDDFDYINKLLTGVSESDAVIIGTNWTYKGGILSLNDANNAFNINIVVDAQTASKVVKLPAQTNTPDYISLRTQTETLTGKTINATSNTITDTGTAQGDLMVSNGTKFIRRGMGTGLQVLRTNSGATDLEWASIQSETVGKSTGNGTGSQTLFQIAHGLGAQPTYAFCQCSTLTTAFTYTVDATNINVTFASAPPTGTGNVVIYWRIVA
jgi:hypothetical protein